LNNIFFRFLEQINFESIVGTCYDESFEADSFYLDVALRRDKRTFDAKLFGQAKQLTEFQDLVKLYHAAQVQMTDKLVEEL
jgi:hypothetical protein